MDSGNRTAPKGAVFHCAACRAEASAGSRLCARCARRRRRRRYRRASITRATALIRRDLTTVSDVPLLPAIARLGRDLERQGLTAPERLAAFATLPDRQQSTYWRDLREHVERERVA